MKKADKGHAVMEGCKIARGEIVCFTDADGATSPREMHRLIKELRGNDAIIGSRWLRESNIVKSQGIFRKTASRGFNILVRLLFALPFKDTQCGAKVFKKVALDDIMGELKFPGYIFDVELIYGLCQKGYKIKETAIT